MAQRDDPNGELDPRDRELLRRIVGAIERVKGVDTAVWDVRGFVVPTSFMVLTTAEGAKQLRALAEAVQEAVEGRPLHREGLDGRQWAVMDYGHVIVHVLTPEARAFYDLDELWGDKPVTLG